jgi:hypothetical protein
MKLTESIKTLVIQIVARDVATGVQMARSLGHQMPDNFDIGVRFVYDREKTRIRIRFDDVTYDSIVKLPNLDGRYPLRLVDKMWKDALLRIHSDSLTLANVWLDKHPESKMTGDNPTKAIAFLDTVLENDELSMKWIEICREHAKHLKYEVKNDHGR